MGLTRPRAYQIFDIDYKQSVRVITLSNITLSGGAPTSVDGVTLVRGDRVLVAGQNSGEQNGLYQVSVLGTGSNGTWIRSVDGNETGEIDAGMIVMVTEGETYNDTQWKLTTNDPIVIGVTALTFEQNSAFAFGNIYANSTAVLADIVGDTVTFTPANNIVILANAATDTITFEVSQNPSFTGALGVTGNITGGNLVTAGQVTATGNITGSNLNTAGQANVGTLTVNGGSTFTGNLLPSANVTYNLGSPTQRWNEIFLAANTIDIGGATISADIETGSLILTGPDGAEFVLTGSSPTDSFGIFGLIEAGNTSAATSTDTGALRVAGGAGIGGNIFAGGLINAVGNVTGGNLITGNSVIATGNITGGNITTAGNVTADYFLGNVSQASGIFTTKIFNGNSEANIVSDSGNLAISIRGTSNIVVISASGLDTSGTLTATGNITGSNLNTAGQVVATGNITGGNVSGTLLTGTLTTAAQPNVTSVGTLSGLAVNGLTTHIGNIDVTGNINVTGNLNYSNVTDLVIGDPLIFIGANNSGNILDLGEVVQWDPGTGTQYGGLVRDASDGVWKLFGNVTTQPTTTVDFTNALYQSILVGPLTASSGSFSTTVTATGNIAGGNVSGTLLTGTLTTESQPNVTSVGTLISLSVTGNITGGNLNTAGQLVATGNITGGNLRTNAVTIESTGAISGVTTLLASGNANVGNIGATAGVFTGAVTGSSTITATGNITGGNLVTAGQVSATGNVNGNFFVGNGSALTGINAFGTITVAGQDNVVANNTSAGVTLVAGDGVVITTAAGTDTITIATSGSTESIFISGGDMGTVDEAVTSEQDLGTINVAATVEIDMGTIVTSGIFYPDQLVFPSYTVAQLANLSATPAGQMVYCSNESGGAVPAFSDGTDWRRVTDRAVVT
jgi:hypothetical protein